MLIRFGVIKMKFLISLFILKKKYYIPYLQNINLNNFQN